MKDLPVTQFGAPEAPFCNPATARVTIIPAPLEYSVSYLQGTGRGPQAILEAPSQVELYGDEPNLSIN
jgi:agmatinase